MIYFPLLTRLPLLTDGDLLCGLLWKLSKFYLSTWLLIANWDSEKFWIHFDDHLLKFCEILFMLTQRIHASLGGNDNQLTQCGE